MQTWIAFLKGINVGGNNILPMKELREIADGLAWADFATYIQSGNCVFRADAPEGAELSKAIEQAKGFAPRVVVVSSQALGSALANNPYAVDPSDENKAFLGFSFDGDVSFDADKARTLATSDEQVSVVGAVCYMHTPNGAGKSKLYQALPKLLDQDVTIRNLRTAKKMLSMAVDL